MKIHALSTGRVDIKTRQVRARSGSRLARLAAVFADPAWTGWVPIHVWVVEHPEGVIVVDTGDAAAPLPGVTHPFTRLAARREVAPGEEIGPQLEQLGIRPADVRLVVMTHLHVDHDGGLRHFPKARTLVAPGEYRAAAGLRGRLQGYYPQRWPRGWAPDLADLAPDPFGPFPRHLPLTRAGDVVLVPTPGHTAHHRSVVVQGGDVAYFLAGDASYTQRAMLEGWVDGVGPSERDERLTLERVRRFAAARPTVYLPSHDPEAARRLERRETTGLEARGGA